MHPEILRQLVDLHVRQTAVHAEKRRRAYLFLRTRREQQVTDYELPPVPDYVDGRFADDDERTTGEAPLSFMK
jgi:hypothetical protein